MKVRLKSREAVPKWKRDFDENDSRFCQRINDRGYLGLRIE